MAAPEASGNPVGAVTAPNTSGAPTTLLSAGSGAITRFLQDSGTLLSTDVPAASGALLNQVRNSASDLVVSAMNFLGVPYKRGGTSVETGFDCSGFTRHVFENSVGLLLPRRSRDQAADPELLKVKRDELKPGDLVFFNTMRSAFSHVGIYLGDGKFIHSPRTGSEVRVEDMREAYWTKRFNGARRAPAAMVDAAAANLNALVRRPFESANASPNATEAIPQPR
ncbi:MAG: C40 family peptidase [Leptothrix sp. (in: b-proteobacteria)]